MRVGQQQATAIGRTLVPYRHRVAAALKRKVGLTRLGHTEGRSRQPRRCTGGRGTGHGFDELPGFPISTVHGHAGELVVGTLAGVQVV